MEKGYVPPIAPLELPQGFSQEEMRNMLAFSGHKLSMDAELVSLPAAVDYAIHIGGYLTRHSEDKVTGNAQLLNAVSFARGQVHARIPLDNETQSNIEVLVTQLLTKKVHAVARTVRGTAKEYIGEKTS